MQYMTAIYMHMLFSLIEFPFVDVYLLHGAIFVLDESQSTKMNHNPKLNQH